MPEFEPGYFQKEPIPFSPVTEKALPPAEFFHTDPGPGYERVDVVPSVVRSNYTLDVSEDYIYLKYKSSNGPSRIIESWPADWTVNVDEVMHWVEEDTKEQN